VVVSGHMESVCWLLVGMRSLRELERAAPRCIRCADPPGRAAKQKLMQGLGRSFRILLPVESHCYRQVCDFGQDVPREALR
jgi:hypothetical protein